MKNVKIVVPWHNKSQITEFIKRWDISFTDSRFIFQQDINKEGCGVTKNKGIDYAVQSDAEIIIVLDDDCYPDVSCPTVDQFIDDHLKALEPQDITMYKTVTQPQSRGTPYFNKTIKMPVAASLGFWNNIPDFCALSQLVLGPNHEIKFNKESVYGMAFAYCGMNVAFRAEFLPWAYFIDLPRVDDIFAGYLFQKEAYRRGYCFNLNGPMVFHSRQSNVWRNLQDEVKYIERNETLWSDILFNKSNNYYELKELIPNKL